MTVLILGGEDDEHAAHMAYYLQTRGTPTEFLDSRDFPTKTRISFDPTSHRGTIQLASGVLLDWDEIESVYWRCYNGVLAPDLPDMEQAALAENDARSFFESFLIRLPARWVNGWNAFQLHQTKPVQLAMVAELGIRVPRTLLSNDPHEVLGFAETEGTCIFKPIQGGAHTRRVTPEHLTKENLLSLDCAPVTLQEEVIGTDTRVFVAGDRVLTCEVRTDAIDFRDDDNPTIVAVELPSEIEQRCREIAKVLDLKWTGIDLRRTDAGEYVFLEANPSPMFIGFEQYTGLPLCESLADLLTKA